MIASAMWVGTTRKGIARARRTAGFTLVELMVVIVIIGLAATAVVLAVPDPGGGVRAEAERFAARAKAARDLAIVESRPVLLRLDSGGYSVSRRRSGEWEESGRHSWSEGTVAGLSGSEEGLIRFDSTGFAEPALLVLRRNDAQAAVRIGGNGEIIVQR